MIIQVLSGSTSEKNPIIVESLFKETTRNGKHTIRIVLLALTRNLLMIASSHSRDNENILDIRSLHPLKSLKISIFKKSKRQILKLRFHNNYYRYFELEKSRATAELWTIWCKNVLQIQQEHVSKNSSKNSLDKSTTYDLCTCKEQWKLQKLSWNDKHLYLGSKREVEDSSRPIPVPGLGPPEDIKLSYLKPQYFGCWEQTEHWVQCESSKLLMSPYAER